uniref:SH3 domain-containing protein n=2 Tax=Parascaris TaxID=6254 RepID=A0A915B8P3_PARUN
MRDDSSKRCASSQRLDMNIQQQSDTSYWYKHMFKKMHRIEQGDQSILKYRARDFASPTPSYISGRAWTPTPRSESRPGSRLEYECAPRRSKSVGRYVDSSLHNDEDIVERWREERARLSTRSPISSQRNLNSTQSSAAVHTNGVSSCRASPTLSSHETSNRFAWERSKIAHFHLPTYRFQRDEDSRPIAGWSMNCMRCGRMRRELSWREIEFLYNSLGKNGVHRESINECLNGRISSAMIGERLDETCRQLQQFLESLDGYRRRTYSSPQLSTLSLASNNPLTECIPSTSKGSLINQLRIIVFAHCHHSSSVNVCCELMNLP